MAEYLRNHGKSERPKPKREIGSFAEPAEVSSEKGIFSFSAKDASGKYKKHSVARLQDNLIKLVTASVESAGDETETGETSLS